MGVAQEIASRVYTLYLFTKSDTPLVVFPMITVAMVLAGPTDLLSFLMAFVWLELHLLAFDIKNQIIGVHEDELCKPHRPFPSGRISLESGESLYFLVVTLSLAFSVYNGLTTVSLIYMLAITLYNELGLSGNPFFKSPLGAVGYTCYTWGTTYIVGHHQPLNNTSTTAVFVSGLIFTMTGHAQDFRDRSGDATLGRRTIPLILPQGIARWSLLVLILGFTGGLVWLWEPPLIVATLFTILGVATTVRFVANHSEEEDRKSFRLYELWLICAHVLPIYRRIASGELSHPFSFGLDYRFSYYVFGAFAFAFFLVVAVLSRKMTSAYAGPPGWPLIGNLLDLRSTQPLLRHPGKTFFEWSKQYGSDTISLSIPGASMLVLHSRKDVAELLVKRSGIYSDRPRVVMLNEIVQGSWLLPFMPYNDRFRTTRKLFHQAVNNHPVTRPNVVLAVRHLLRRLLDTVESYDKEFRFMTGEFILLSTYGIAPSATDDPYIKRTNELVTTISESNQRDNYLVDVFPILKHVPTWLPGAVFKRSAMKSRQLLQDARMLPWQFVLDQLAQGTAKPSLASRFIESLDPGTDRDNDVNMMRSALGNVYLGASDTTMAGTWSCILALALHPEVQRKGRAIVDAALGGRLPDFSDFETMPYLHAIVNESLRWNPVTPLGVPHCARKDDFYDGHFIRKGTMVFGNIWALLRDEKAYGSDTDKFIPERWLTMDGAFNPEMDTEAAFGFGRRICPGKDLAREVMWLTVASLLATFDIGYPVDKDGMPLKAENVDAQYTQRPVSVAPFFRNSFRPRSTAAVALIREGVEEA